MVLRISSEGGDQRFFFAFEIFDSGIFLDRKIRQVFFGVDIETYTEILALTHVISFN